MSYRIEWSRGAVREFRALPVEFSLRIGAAVTKLSDNPRPIGSKKLTGHTDLWRIRIGQYRVIYFVADTIRLVRSERVSHRKDVYR